MSEQEDPKKTESEEEGDYEGLAPPAHGLEAYPIDSVLIRTEQRTIIDVLRRIDRKTIKLDPEFQRDFVWDEERQSRLIESILMRIPLPVFYLAEEKDGTLVVVDGLHRLSTMQRFRDGVLCLTLPNDTANSELNDKVFEDLPQRLRDRFEDGQITLYLIDPRLPDRVRLDIFDRVNSGVPLTRQQMRNALYNGPATRLLKELAEEEIFREATHGALSKSRYKEKMLDRKAVNRFVAFRLLGWKWPTDDPLDFDDRLGQALKQLNASAPAMLASIKDAFLASMRANLAVFGDYAFRRHTSPNERKKPFNVNLFDVFSVMFARWPEEILLREAEKIRAGFYELLARPEYLRSLSDATTSAASISVRFDSAETMLKEILGDP